MCSNLLVFLFLLTSCLVVAVQPCMEWIPIKKKDRLVIVAKGFLRLPNFHMLIKKQSITFKKVGFGTLEKLLVVFSTNINLLYILYSTTWRCCLLHLIKQNCLLKAFLRTLSLMTWMSLYLFSLLELIWNC